MEYGRFKLVDREVLFFSQTSWGFVQRIGFRKKWKNSEKNVIKNHGLWSRLQLLKPLIGYWDLSSLLWITSISTVAVAEAADWLLRRFCFPGDASTNAEVTIAEAADWLLRLVTNNWTKKNVKQLQLLKPLIGYWDKTASGWTQFCSFTVAVTEAADWLLRQRNIFLITLLHLCCSCWSRWLATETFENLLL